MSGRLPTQRAPFHPFGDWPFWDEDEGDGYEADVKVPPAGWNQQPHEFNSHPHFDPTTRWGGVQLAVIAPNVLGGVVTQPTLQILDTTLQVPAVCCLRLSAQQLDSVALGANDFVTWTVMLGVGESTQTRFYKKAISPVDGSVDQDIFLPSIPVQHVAITAVVSLTQAATLERRFQIAAQLAARAVSFGNVR